MIGVVYHPSNNELVRTNTLTKSAVVQIDAAPFRQWYEAHYGQPIGRRRQQKQGKEEEAVKKSHAVEKKQAARFAEKGKPEPAVEKQFEAGRLYAVISSRPGQSGRCDGYILEGEELAFYQRNTCFGVPAGKNKGRGRDGCPPTLRRYAEKRRLLGTATAVTFALWNRCSWICLILRHGMEWVHRD